MSRYETPTTELTTPARAYAEVPKLDAEEARRANVKQLADIKGNDVVDLMVNHGVTGDALSG